MSLRPGEIIDGDYNIIKIIGAGAMGKVYLAKNNHGFYAIKESADFSSGEDKESQLSLKSLRKEATMLCCIKHPGLPEYCLLHL